MRSRASGEAGRTFRGGSAPRFTLGGEIGLPGSVSPNVESGICAHWNVVWHGRDALHFVVRTAYGPHLSSRF